MSLSRCFIALTAIYMIFTVIAFAEVPNMISYQGRLTDDAGSPVADGDYTIVFNIYNTKILVGMVLWTDTMTVTTSEGLFTVLLGEETPLSPDIFNGTTKYLGTTIVGEEEMSPRTPIVSVPYAMVAGSAGSGSVDCNSCDAIFVNQTGPETITGSAVDTTLTVVNTGNGIKCGVNVRVDGSNDAGDIYGIKSSAANNGSGNFPAYGGLFQASGGDAMQYGVYGQGSNNAPVLPAYGVYGHGRNASPDGHAYGGYFAANGTDPSNHYGARGYANAKGASLAVGLNGEGGNSDEGPAIGGLFVGGSAGTGRHFGVKSFGYGNYDSTATGVYGYASNTGVGKAIGGEFITSSSGTGDHYGVRASAISNAAVIARGVYGYASNPSNGHAYGGHFVADSLGTGFHIGTYSEAFGNQTYTYGMYAYSLNKGSLASNGVYGFAYNSGTGEVFGGKFVSQPLGGSGYGVHAKTYAYYGSEPVYSTYAEAVGYIVSQPCYGGFFLSKVKENARQYGVYCLADSSTGTNSVYGIYGRSQHSGSGTSYASYFLADSNGTGTSYGSRLVGLSKGTANAYGVASVAANRSTGTVYGGYFEMLNYGTGGGYGIYAKARTTGAPASWAGYFEGHVKVTGVLSVLGTKSASVKVDDGTYHNLYCQESPENWFEDFGEGQLTGGRAHIELDQLFLQTVTIDQNNPMKVFVQLNDPDCNGTAVIRGKTGFDVVELMNGTGHASFSYRVVAKRRGYEQVRLDTMLGPTPEEAAAEAALNNEQLEADMKAAEQDRIKQQEVESRREAEKSLSSESLQ